MEPMKGHGVLHQPIRDDVYWTRSNVGEAMPGVLTPLGWTMFGTAGELALRGGPHFAGLFSRQESRIPDDPTQRALSVFYGRVAARADVFALVGDRAPGTSGTAVVEQVLGFVPPGMEDHPSYRRLPIVAVRFPYSFFTTDRRVAKCREYTDTWWREQTARVTDLDRDEATAVFAQSRQMFNNNMILASVAVLCVVTPMYEQLKRLVLKADVGDVNGFMGGYGSHAETAVVADIWAASRGRMDLEQVVARHGYHGPREGEISGVMWREDSTPLERMVEAYAARTDEAAPEFIEAARRSERERLEKALLASFSGIARKRAALILRLAERTIPQRGVQKVAFLQALDVCRASARRIGETLVRDGVLGDREDVFFLTAGEITGSMPADLRAVVRERRAQYEEYQSYDLPESWQGTPEPIRVSDYTTCEVTEVTGVGVSPGTAEGTVRVVTDPSFAEVKPDEILVAPTTDPSWASIMFVSKALVVDIGGTMSHAAVVARELGIPCVVNTKSGSRDLRTGDYCRVDGATGRVEVLRRGAPLIEPASDQFQPTP
jgi:pyruvate,water dikinase